MRGLVLEGRTSELSFLRLAAVILVSGRNSGEAPDNDTAPERTYNIESVSGNATNDPWASKKAQSFSQKTPWFNPDVSVVPTQIAVASGFHHEPAPEWTSAENFDADLDLIMEILEADLSSETVDRAAFLSNETPTPRSNPDVSTVTAQVAGPSGCKRSHSVAERKPVAKKARCDTPQEPSREERRTLEDAFAALKGPATEGSDGSCTVVNCTQYPEQTEAANKTHVVSGDTSLMDSTDSAATSSGPPVSHTSQNQPLAGALEQTLGSSASTPGEENRQALTSGWPLTIASLFERSCSVPGKGGFTVCDAAQQLLLSPEGATAIQRWPSELTRTRARSDMANAPYLSSAWLLERLVLHNKVPAYCVQLQTALECYGYDNVSIADLSRRALDLAYTLKLLGKDDTSLQPRHSSQDPLISSRWAAEMVRDAFFRGRNPRPDFKSYLRSKVKIQKAGKLKLPVIQGRLRKKTTNILQLIKSLCSIERAINPQASLSSHPMSFTFFLNDVGTLIRNIRRKSTRGSKESTNNTGPPKVFNAKDGEVAGIVSKYKKLFKVDLAADVEAMLKATPEVNGPDLFNSAVKESYVPFDLLRPEGDPHNSYNLNAHCLLGSITALYRKLFEDTNGTSSLETAVSRENSDSNAFVSDANDGSSHFDVVRQYLLQPLPAADIESRLSVKDFDLLSAASDLLKLWKQDLNPSLDHSSLSTIPEQIAPLIRPYTLFGTPQWILAQLKHECCPEEHEWRRNELQFALDLCGHQSIDIKDVFAKASVLATAILTKREIPFENAIEKLKLSKTLKACLLAADIIHVALFQTWPKHQGVPEHIAKQIKYEVLPEHKECLQQCLAKREEWHPCSAIRLRRGGKAVFSDWLRIQMAKTSSMEDREDKHPLSFDRFWRDVECINEGNNPAIPAIASKYKVLFNRDIVKDLKLILEHAPQICYRNSFVKGIEEGYVPYCWAKLLTIPRWSGTTVNNNALCLLGAYVDYYLSLIGPTDATVFQGTLIEGDTILAQAVGQETLLSGNEDLLPKTALPKPEQQRTLLMAILNRAPAQKPIVAEVLSTEPPELHPVARYLLGRS
eukprot:Blabericola_migrator_1__721@NODE_117_length_13797_cov_16_424545_g105_i0_p3_GENE_NODE_117_length_13797_cov_16_424545_g105_i0NODE_117_length_13797_cov_16_424545_g105_i0_p3_ORF_typecomplete_len1077_score180_41Annexin/PF00191_20/36Annexin/PF00191_20/11_NODE_117_length_13797_cov_16_424545_g105_i051238353